MKNNNLNLQNEVQDIVDEILNILEIKAKVKTDIQTLENEEYKISVEIDTEDAKALIGHHGETLSSLQHILNTILFRKYGAGVSVWVDVSGYRKERNQKLVDIAQSAADKAKFLNKSIALYPMNSYERKIIHEKVSELEGVKSYSEGEDPNRRVIISPA